jgi:Na+-driven multidrug efflux pump
LPEVVITLMRDEQSMEKLRRFCMNIGLGASGVLAVTALTNIDSLIFVHVLHVKDQEVVRMAHLALALSCFLPLIGALQSYLRGILAAYHLTVSRLAAILVSITCMISVLALGVWQQWSGIVTSCVAATAAQSAEVIILARAWKRGRARL